MQRKLSFTTTPVETYDNTVDAQKSDDDYENNEGNDDDNEEQDKSQENHIAGAISANLSSSKLSEFINIENTSDRNSLTSDFSVAPKTHRKQHSISDESFSNITISSNMNRKSSSNVSAGRRQIKKTRVRVWVEFSLNKKKYLSLKPKISQNRAQTTRKHFRVNRCQI